MTALLPAVLRWVDACLDADADAAPDLDDPLRARWPDLRGQPSRRGPITRTLIARIQEIPIRGEWL